MQEREEVTEYPSIDEITDGGRWDICLKQRDPIKRPLKRQGAIYEFVS